MIKTRFFVKQDKLSIGVNTFKYEETDRQENRQTENRQSDNQTVTWIDRQN